MKKERLQLVKDGALQGWFIAAFITAFDFFFLALAFLNVGSIQAAWDKVGDKAITLTGVLVGAWFAYKGTKGAVETIQKTRLAIKNNQRDDCDG